MKMLGVRVVFSAVCFMLLFVNSLQPSIFESDSQTNIVLDVQERLDLDRKFLRPAITFVVENSELSMNSNFFVDEDSLSDITMWQIQIFKNSGDRRKVSFMQGRGVPSSFSFPWSGFSNKGDLLPNGFYSARFIWMDSQKNIHKTPKSFFSLINSAPLKYLSGLKLRVNYTAQGLVISVHGRRLFQSGQFKIRKESMGALKKVIAFLKSYPKNKVVVRGHTDSIGMVEYNKILSFKRAFFVYKYLVNNGINPNQLSYEGRGSDNPIASNVTEEGRSKNRRVDIVVLKSAG
ncbi:MAG: OmpA family protein [Elusimicrobiales bacterium]|nr:OmpA family protein [Elusimicrobiales bacterium]